MFCPQAVSLDVSSVGWLRPPYAHCGVTPALLQKRTNLQDKAVNIHQSKRTVLFYMLYFFYLYDFLSFLGDEWATVTQHTEKIYIFYVYLYIYSCKHGQCVHMYIQ